MKVFFWMLAASGACWAQADECKPSPLNIPGAPYPCVHADRSVTFRVAAPDAQKVQVRLGGAHDMKRGADGLWMVTIPPQVAGFHYYSLVVDGAVVADPATRTFFGSGWDNSGIEIPAPDEDFYAAKDVPHGDVRQHWYYSKVTGQWRRSYVYTPPEYDSNPRSRYPVLYLLHGWGENEQGWHTQGHVDFIMDNLIAEKKAKPMIIVMDNLNAVKPGEDASLYFGRGIISRRSPADVEAAGRGGFPQRFDAVFTEMMLTDLIPAVERSYRVAPGRENRAMAGLSMGGMQTSAVTMANLDKFSYIGFFSGGAAAGGPGRGRGGAPGTPAPPPAAPAPLDLKTIYNGQMAVPAEFNKKVKVLFMSCGSMENAAALRAHQQQLAAAGIAGSYVYISPGTAHEWQTWRRSLYAFAPLLFR
jgi:enterochelin esterase-like enzyme